MTKKELLNVISNLTHNLSGIAINISDLKKELCGRPYGRVSDCATHTQEICDCVRLLLKHVEGMDE